MPESNSKKSRPPTCEELLRLFRIFNTIMGLPVFVIPESLTGFAVYVFFMYQHFTEAVVVMGVFGQFWAVPHIMNDMNVLCACIASGTHSLQVVVKTFLIHYFLKQKILKHFEDSNVALSERSVLERKLLEISPTVEDFRSYFHRQTRFVRIVLVVFFSMMAASTTFYFIPIDIESILRRNDLEGQFTPIVFYFHWNFMYTPAFQIVNIFLTLCFYLVNIKTVVFESFFLAYVVFHTVQFRYLKLLLDAMVTETEKVGSTKKWEKEMFKLWFLQHQAQLRLTYDFLKLMSPYLLIEFAYVFIHTCVPAFVITSTSTWTAAQKFGVCFIAGAGLVQLLFISRAGDFLTEAAGEVTNSLYRYRIFKMNEDWQRYAFNMAAVRAKVPIKLRAASIFPLCCPTFLTISRLIVSYYMTLNEVQRMKAEK